MEKDSLCENEGPCTESKLLALHTAIVCLARTLAESGQLDRDKFKMELNNGRIWVQKYDDQLGHNVQAFDGILGMLSDV